MQSKITLTGMYNFDNTLFDNLHFPDGINRDLAINRILNKSEEFELVYSDFDYLKDRIGIWGEIWERTFKKWAEALDIEYEPLYNYDRYEEYEDSKKNGYTNTSSSESSTETGSSSNSATSNKVCAYDTETYSNKEYEDANASTSQTGTGSSEAASSGSSDETIKHKAHLYGNIGITTSVQMLREQLSVVEWNLYEHISDIFIDEFCILVY